MISNNFTGPHNARTESVNDFSITVPGQSRPLRDLLDRHLNGGVTKTREGVYLGDSELVPDGLERMSSIDRAAYARDLGDFVATTRGAMQSRRAAAQKSAAEQAIIDAYEKRKADSIAAADV